MSDCNEDHNETEEEILGDEVSDEAVEAASGAPRGFPTLCMVLIASLVRRSAANLVTKMKRGGLLGILLRSPNYCERLEARFIV
jgi:hypothetical protein